MAWQVYFRPLITPSSQCPLQVLLCLYPFLWFRLYSFLFRQRRKRLGAPAGAAGSKKQA